MWQPDAQKLWVMCWTVGIYFTDVKNVVAKHRHFTIFKMERFQSLPSSSSFFSWKMSNVHIYRSRHFLRKISKLCGIFIIWDLDSFILLSVCFLFWMGTAESCMGTLLGILPDGYSVWIRAKFQPRPECVCWTAHCISGDHTGSISMSKSLCYPLSLSEHVPLGSGS